MNPEVPLRLLLGPQRPVANLDSTVALSGIGDGAIGVISAAWQEAEGDIDDVQRLVQHPLSDLRIYERTEDLFAADKHLHEAYRLRQDRLKEQQRLYRMRLEHLMVAARQTLRTEGDLAVVATERRHAISQLRALDRHHLGQVKKVHSRFDSEFDASSHALLSEHAAAIEDELSHFETVLITGGNVIVLMNRLRLFGLDRHLRGKNIIAWSAGAMVLTDHIVLFHDHMPQGRRDPEIVGQGMGLLPGIVLLPDAKRRLRAKDLVGTKLFSRRFAPAACMTLDNGSLLLFEGKTLRDSESARRLTRDGRSKRVRAA